MSRSAVFFLLALACAAFSSSLPALIAGEWAWASVSILLALAWWAANRRGYRWGSAAFVVFVCVSALGMLSGQPKAAMIVSISAALAAWDLDHWILQVRDRPQDLPGSGMENRHLEVLAVVIGVGTLAGILAVSLSIPLSFWPAALVCLLLAIMLRQALSKFRQG